MPQFPRTLMYHIINIEMNENLNINNKINREEHILY